MREKQLPLSCHLRCRFLFKFTNEACREILTKILLLQQQLMGFGPGHYGVCKCSAIGWRRHLFLTLAHSLSHPTFAFIFNTKFNLSCYWGGRRRLFLTLAHSNKVLGTKVNLFSSWGGCRHLFMIFLLSNKVSRYSCVGL